MARPLPVLFQQPQQQSTLAQELGAGLGAGLENLAQQRLQGLAQRQQMQQQAKGLEALGYSPEQAEALGGIDPKNLDTILKQRADEQRAQSFQEALGMLRGEQPTHPGVEQEGQQTPGLLSPEDVRRLAEFEQKERQFGEKQRSEAFKQTADIRKENIDRERSTLEELDRIKIIEGLEGNLDHPAKVKILEKMGLEWLLSPESQTSQKLRNDFVVNARALFGAKPPAALVERYLQSIPNLMQSKEGRKQIIKTFKHMRQGALLRGKAMRDIIKDNKGTPPLDLNEQIEERVQPQLEKLSDKFIESITIPDISVGSTFSGDPRDLPKGTEIEASDGKVYITQGKGKAPKRKR